MSPASLAPGPVPLSNGLVRLLRLRRAMKARLPDAAPYLEPGGRDVSLEFLLRTERDRGIAFPYDVVALATLRIPLFQWVTGLSLVALEGLILDCAGMPARAPRGSFPLSSFSRVALKGDLQHRQNDRTSILYVDKNVQRTGEPSVWVMESDGVSAARSLSELVIEHLASRWGLAQGWKPLLLAVAEDTQPIEEMCTPRIVDDRPLAGPIIRVVHPTFGEGAILRTTGDKVEIAFDSGETRMLLRKFVREI